LYDYRKYNINNNLAKLEEEPNLILIEKLPVLDGATALYPVYASFAQAVYPKIEDFDLERLVLVNTTPMAYENLLAGNADKNENI